MSRREDEGRRGPREESRRPEWREKLRRLIEEARAEVKKGAEPQEEENKKK